MTTTATRGVFAKLSRYITFPVVLILILLEGINYQEGRLQKLSQTVLSRSTDTETARRDIETLTNSWDPRKVKYLLRIATAEGDFIDGRQLLAIEKLGARQDPGINAKIAALLQPHVSLGRREAVSAVIEKGFCNDDCARHTLHYLERVWSGTAKQDDVTMAALSGVAGSAGEAIEREQSNMVAQLFSALKQNPTSTIRVLHNTYGLGSPEPSSFSLFVLGKVPLHEACTPLHLSKLNLSDPIKAQSIDDLLGELHCEAH